MLRYPAVIFGIGGAIGSIVVASMRLPRRYLTLMIAAWGLGCAPLVVIGTVVAVAAREVWPLLVFAPIGLLVVALLRYRVEVDATGLRAYGFGLKAFDIDIDEVVKAEVTQISPFRHFGGWGLRATGKKRYGIVTRTGPAVVVTTASGHTFTVTTDRAKEVAGLLNAAADRRRT